MTTDRNALVVTSSGAPAAAVVPVLAALEAAGMRVRAIDVGAAGGGGGAFTDRVRRALLGESAERRLRRELEANPPDVAIAFDPHAALSLTVARDQVPNPAPVIGVVSELEPLKDWGHTDCDRLCAIDREAAVALADAGVEPDRILVTGALGERAWADAGADDRGAIRTRHALPGRVVVVEIAGLGAELTGQVLLQLSLWGAAEATTFLFDATDDTESASVVRAQVALLGLRAKLFGATAEAARFWRAAEIVVARPRPHAIARAALVGARLCALIDDTVPGAARIAAALEARGRGAGVKTPLLLTSALDAWANAPMLAPADDGADAVADAAWVVAGDKRAVIEERRVAARRETGEKLRSATAAATAAVRSNAAPGDLEDLGGPAGPAPSTPPPSREMLDQLRAEARARVDQLNKVMLTARTDAADAEQKASHARGRGDADTARHFERKAEAERNRMHGLLAEMAELERELAGLEAAAKDAAHVRVPPAASPPPSAGAPPPRARDPLEDLKRQVKTEAKKQDRTVDDELSALKRKMAEGKKPPGK